ncbi:hypothetical protein L1987_38983 [Smallanthus sonchifolius]|uniref:Uncharacterized protein n=1 Tax=Smallanthus sonchifolius TaxID=185202 RepID=A0ACB9HM21_9ASTR|nr:hypothetical protein L1987_38983 [Smallanthus sonchifolius]
MWRTFRLASEILHPARVKSYSGVRKWVVQILIQMIQEQQEDVEGVKVVDHFRYAMFCLLMFMCFGEMVDERTVAYVDTLVNLQLPGEDGNNGSGGRLNYMEMSSMCSEFLNAENSTTKYWELSGLYREKEWKLRPPYHFLLPHRVMKEVEVEGYMIPKGVIINFMVSEMGLDPKVWDEPMEFKLELFLVDDGVFDISGSTGIKMMHFGAGRRICPSSDLALLHLEYFVANLVWYFDWSVPDGCHVDLDEKIEFTIVMKNPRRARVSSRAQGRRTT